MGCVPVLVHNYNQYDIDKYGRFNNNANQNDSIDGHELIQNAWLQEHGYIFGRGQGISRQNIAIGLTPTQHKLVNTLQSEAGMYTKEYLQNVSWQQNLLDNAYILSQIGVPQSAMKHRCHFERENPIIATVRGNAVTQKGHTAGKRG